ncbi:MAG: hypothetical protein HZA54_07185 [Planctomycetes bacterium]|nr:hypothetical protein [Planctomycetota bacterium]
MRTAFKDVTLELAATDERLVLLFGDISVYLFREFTARYPERFFNAGICENTLVSMAAGMASQGLFPIVHTIAPFVTERSYEQIKDDVCYNGFGINIVTCGASFDYAWDGATHHCYTDLEILRLLPGMEVMQPGSKKEFCALLRSQYANGLPSYYRISHDEHGEDLPVSFGRGVVVRDAGAAVTVLTAGPILGNVLKAVAGLEANVVYFHTLKPLDTEVLRRFAHTKLLVVHDAFGLFEAVAAEVPGVRLWRHALPDQFNVYYGKLDDIRRAIGLDPEGIRAAVRRVQAEP